MRYLQAIDRILGDHMPLVVFLGLLLGVLFPEQLGFLRAIMPASMAFMTFTNSLGGGFRDMGRVLSRPMPVLATVAMLHFIMPALMVGVGRILLPDQPLFATGLVLLCCIPTAISSLMWVSMGGGNVQLCLSLVLLDTLIAPFLIPAVLRLFVGSNVQLDSLGMMKDLVLMIALPSLAAIVLHDLTRGRVTETVQPVLRPISKIAMTANIIGNATGCASFLRHPDRNLVLVGTLVIATFSLGFAVGYFLGRLFRWDFPTVFTVSINNGMRNNALGATLAVHYFPPDVLFPVALGPIVSQFSASIASKILLRSKAHKEAEAAGQDGPGQ